MMPEVLIGIHVQDEPSRVQATLASLRACGHASEEILLLVDGQSDETREASRAWASLAQSATEEPRGAAACFNRLASFSDSPVIVFLEAGCQVGLGWLYYLRGALRGDPANGLAGPSTNNAWNEQCIFPRASGRSYEVAATAYRAARMYAGGWRTLGPLHSLADFCYAVRRDVIETIGGADEAYGTGPCWEMDYNVRAARAGFHGVWARGAYVFRPPFGRRRAADEPRLLAENARRYQRKFCALHLRGERADFEPHCLGDACEHFAPSSLVSLNIPLPGAPGPRQSGPRPLVSCVMVTGGRPDFARQAIRYFLQQDYEPRELIIIDDGPHELAPIPAGAAIHHHRVSGRRSIGAKRNLGCQLAHGDIVAQWDDDDWYAPTRLSHQVLPLVAGGADISGLTAEVFFDLPRWQFWTCTDELHRRIFRGDVHGGTLVYRKSVWDRIARYPDVSLAEDAAFLETAIRGGARLARLTNGGRFVYLRHASNSWAFECGRYVDPHAWRRVDAPRFNAGDLSFYRSRTTAASAWAKPIESEETAGAPGIESLRAGGGLA